MIKFLAWVMTKIRTHTLLIRNTSARVRCSLPFVHVTHYYFLTCCMLYIILNSMLHVWSFCQLVHFVFCLTVITDTSTIQSGETGPRWDLRARVMAVANTATATDTTITQDTRHNSNLTMLLPSCKLTHLAQMHETTILCKFGLNLLCVGRK